MGGDGALAIVHNGVIDNYGPLKKYLQSEGYAFQSETDTEVISHLIAHYLDGDLVEAVRKALSRLKGTYGLAVISPRFPGLVVGARLGSPLVLGVGQGEAFLTSDASALAGYTQRIIYLDDEQLCVLTPDDWEVLNHDLVSAVPQFHALDWEPQDTDK